MNVGHLFASLDIRVTWRQARELLRRPLHVLLIDGADHLSPWVWWRLRREVLPRKMGLVITSHRPGMLSTWVACETSAQLLAEIVDRLLNTNSKNADNGRAIREECVRPGFAEELYRQHCGNIRDALRSLYDVMAAGDLDKNTESSREWEVTG